MKRRMMVLGCKCITFNPQNDEEKIQRNASYAWCKGSEDGDIGCRPLASDFDEIPHLFITNTQSFLIKAPRTNFVTYVLKPWLKKTHTHTHTQFFATNGLYYKEATKETKTRFANIVWNGINIEDTLVGAIQDLQNDNGRKFELESAHWYLVP